MALGRDQPGLRHVPGGRNGRGRWRLLGGRSVVVQPGLGRERGARGTGRGAWKSAGANKRKFLLTYVNLTFDGFGTGNATGTLKVRQTAKLDQTGNTYRGSGGCTYYDLAGKVVLTGPFTITAARIQVEAPAAP